jgi:hypothetical protein
LISHSHVKMPARKRSRKLRLDTKSQWARILKSVEKKEVPVEVLDRIIVNLKDGTSVEISIIELINEGWDPQRIESRLNQRLQELDQYITDVDFFINLDSVVATVKPRVDKLLKDL